MAYHLCNNDVLLSLTLLLTLFTVDSDIALVKKRVAWLLDDDRFIYGGVNVSVCFCSCYLIFPLNALQSRNPEDWSINLTPRQPFGAKVIVDILSLGLFSNLSKLSYDAKKFLYALDLNLDSEDAIKAIAGPIALAITAACLFIPMLSFDLTLTL